ncbi:MAG: HD domain-containing protein, partial [Candidatus Margulisbacteria bacterium]|nr:HD domain-containing protein [Candidatus Margulisiibacteriota bacterium]
MTQNSGLPGGASVPVSRRSVKSKYFPNWFRLLNANLWGNELAVMSNCRHNCSQQLLGLKEKFSAAEGRLIDQAFELAWRAHYGQFRLSNEPYVTHALATAQIVKEWGLGAEEIAAALCHDVVEDGLLNGNKIDKEYVAGLLGNRVADLVDGITELGKEPDYVGSKPSKDYIFGKLLEATRKDPSVLIVKFADRLHNMRTLAYAKSESARKKAAETLYIYSPIADISGMWVLKRDFEELAFEYLEPERYQ